MDITYLYILGKKKPFLKLPLFLEISIAITFNDIIKSDEKVETKSLQKKRQISYI